MFKFRFRSCQTLQSWIKLSRAFYVGVKVRDVVESILEMCVGLAQLPPHRDPHF
jgi:hypothetical protein